MIVQGFDPENGGHPIGELESIYKSLCTFNGQEFTAFLLSDWRADFFEFWTENIRGPIICSCAGTIIRRSPSSSDTGLLTKLTKACVQFKLKLKPRA